MQLIDFQSSSIWKQNFIDFRNDLERTESGRLLSTIKTNAEEEIVRTWNDIPEAFSCLRRLAVAILTIFSSTYAVESLFSDMK